MILLILSFFPARAWVHDYFLPPGLWCDKRLFLCFVAVNLCCWYQIYSLLVLQAFSLTRSETGLKSMGELWNRMVEVYLPRKNVFVMPYFWAAPANVWSIFCHVSQSVLMHAQWSRLENGTKSILFRVMKSSSHWKHPEEAVCLP